MRQYNNEVFYVVRAGTLGIQQRGKHNNRGAVFSAWAMPRSYLEGNWRYNSVAGYSPDSNGLSTEAGESSLFEFVIGKRLVKKLYRSRHY
jgi:hypothetical protein